ncbi:hypothetical protein SAY86_010873 [Trapa natans]|uniref:Uncharacterized protein n=1 Tax=Trapa natans TaxID=22666 RepID=A0AAN7R3P5_TRANT|nr:hypothetical protein SAY86_010873 [Trapa natans]
MRKAANKPSLVSSRTSRMLPVSQRDNLKTSRRLTLESASTLHYTLHIYRPSSSSYPPTGSYPHTADHSLNHNSLPQINLVKPNNNTRCSHLDYSYMQRLLLCS